MKNLLFILTVAAMLSGATNSVASPPIYSWDREGNVGIFLTSCKTVN